MGVSKNEETNEAMLVMEYMKNGSLEDLLFRDKVTLTREEITRLALDVAKGLNYLHSLNPKIIHRDLKGANVLVRISIEVIEMESNQSYSCTITRNEPKYRTLAPHDCSTRAQRQVLSLVPLDSSLLRCCNKHRTTKRLTFIRKSLNFLTL